MKIDSDKEKEINKLSKFNLAQIKAILSFISEIDLKGITAKRLKLFDDQELDGSTIKTLKTLLSKQGGSEIIETHPFEKEGYKYLRALLMMLITGRFMHPKIIFPIKRKKRFVNIC